MGRLLTIMTVVVTSFFTQSYVNAQSTELNTRSSRIENLSGTHSFTFDLGWKVNERTSTYATLSTVNAETNFSGSIGYQYWFNNEWSVDASVNVFHEESNVKFARVSTTSIVPILFGFSYYPEALALGQAGRPHFGLKTGVYIGSGTESGGTFPHMSSFGSSTVNESVLGMEASTGIDFILVRWLKIGPSFSYHLISDFDERVGDRKNYSGPVFSFKIGILL